MMPGAATGCVGVSARNSRPPSACIWLAIGWLDDADLADRAALRAHRPVRRDGHARVAGREVDRLALRVEYGVAIRVGERAIRHGAEVAGAREPRPLWRVHREEAVPADREVERVARVGDRPLLRVAVGHAVLGESDVTSAGR